MKNILIIEDDIALGETISNYFKLKGFNAKHVDNGALGLQTAFAELPDVILCDINIPVIDGYNVHNILSETVSTHSIPFIFLTAKTSLKDIRKGMQLGADDYITKPFDFNDLFDAVTTRIKKAEKIRKTSEDKFKSLLNNSPHGTFVCQANNFIVVNRKLAEYFGYSEVDMLDKCIADFIVEDDKSEVLTAMNDCLKTKQKEFSIEFTAFDKNRKTFKCKLVGGFSYYKGMECIVGTLVNISSGEYTLNDVVLSSNELKELGKAIETFSSDYNVISKNLVEKLSAVFESHEEQDSIEVDLSPREKEVLIEVCDGKSTSEIAKDLFISERTVEKHRASIVQKTQSKNMIEAVVCAIKNRLIQI